MRRASKGILHTSLDIESFDPFICLISLAPRTRQSGSQSDTRITQSYDAHATISWEKPCIQDTQSSRALGLSALGASARAIDIRCIPLFAREERVCRSARVNVSCIQGKAAQQSRDARTAARQAMHVRQTVRWHETTIQCRSFLKKISCDWMIFTFENIPSPYFRPNHKRVLNTVYVYQNMSHSCKWVINNSFTPTLGSNYSTRINTTSLRVNRKFPSRLIIESFDPFICLISRAPSTSDARIR